MIRRVALDISEEFRASIIRMTGICETGTTLAVTTTDALSVRQPVTYLDGCSS
jgi:hypothetical protein